MGILYLATELILLVSIILIKKNDKELNLLSWICISIVAMFCYNTFVCYILTFFTILSKLWLLGIINISLSSILIVKIIKCKKIQKYKFSKENYIYVVLIFLITLLVAYMNFGYPFNVNYETGDPSVHYLTSIEFAESETLLANTNNDAVYGDFSARKTVSYVNSGLLMKSLCPDLDAIECYNIFVCFGIFTLFLTGITLYSIMENYAKKREHKLWAFAISVICMLGYPLNSFLFGFEYLSMGLLVICAIFCLIWHYQNEKIDINYFTILMALLNFGLFCSYYMFVPFVYPAMWIYFCVTNYYKTKRVVTKELIYILTITLLVPFILGYIYHLAPNIYAIFINNFSNIDKSMELSSYLVNSGLAVNGYIYINLYSNMLLLIPLTIYLFIKKAREKDLKSELFMGLMVLFCIMFIEILLIGNKFGKVSMYYLSKNYFALWIILGLCNYKALLLISEKSNYVTRLLIIAYTLGAIIFTTFSNTEVYYVLRNLNENILSFYEIFGANKTIIFNKPIDLNQAELEIIKYARNNLDYTKKIEIVADEQPNYWIYALLRYINDEGASKKAWGQDKLNIRRYLLTKNINKVDYIIYFNKSKEYNKLKDKLFENAEIIYENSAGGILKYNNKEE